MHGLVITDANIPKKIGFLLVIKQKLRNFAEIFN